MQSRQIGHVIKNDKFSIGLKSCHNDYCTQKLGKQANLLRVFPLFPISSSLHGTQESAEKDESQTNLLQSWQKRSLWETSRRWLSSSIFDWRSYPDHLITIVWSAKLAEFQNVLSWIFESISCRLKRFISMILRKIFTTLETYVWELIKLYGMEKIICMLKKSAYVTYMTQIDKNCIISTY